MKTWIRNQISKYSWYILRWSLGLKDKDNGYVWAYMAHPEGYVIHEQQTIENEMGFKAQVVTFRREDIPDPRPLQVEEERRAGLRGGYL